MFLQRFLSCRVKGLEIERQTRNHMWLKHIRVLPWPVTYVKSTPLICHLCVTYCATVLFYDAFLFPLLSSHRGFLDQLPSWLDLSWCSSCVEPFPTVRRSRVLSTQPSGDPTCQEFSQPQPSGDPTCSDGGILVPASVSMSSTRKSKFGADKCVDGDLDTVCVIRFAQFFNCFILLYNQLGVHHQEEALLHHHPWLWRACANIQSERSFSLLDKNYFIYSSKW